MLADMISNRGHLHSRFHGPKQHTIKSGCSQGSLEMLLRVAFRLLEKLLGYFVGLLAA